MAKIEIESTDSVFWTKLINWLTSYPRVVENSTTLRILEDNEPPSITDCPDTNDEQESIDEMFDRIDEAFVVGNL
jgi:hypothetical protein